MAYTLANLTVTPRGKWKGDLRENGVIVAKFNRGATIRGWEGEFKIKFFSTAAEQRFSEHCGILSGLEVVELLVDRHVKAEAKKGK